MSSLGARLSTERNRRFVGREKELSLFHKAITSNELPFNILHVFGPGGVGKTSLSRQFTQRCENLNILITSIEARNLEPTPDSFLNALSSAMSLLQKDSLFQELANNSERRVIFIDTYEAIATLDDWLREEFLPQISLNTLVVLSGRNPPSSAWRSDAGWQALIHILPLRNLSSEESFKYLSNRQIPETQHQAILDFTHGYPLALSLIADVFAQENSFTFQPESAPNVIKTLLERFIQEVPTATHRLALEACAVLRITTEALLSQMLDITDTHNLFQWLRGLSFIESGHLGLFPHDLAREVLISELKWRNPDFYAHLHHRARQYYTLRLGQTQGAEKHAVLFDYIFLHRDNAAIRSSFTWGESSNLLTDSLRSGDKEPIIEMVAQFEGEESAKIAAHWITRQPQNVIVFRDAQPIPAGFTIMVELHSCTQEDLNLDPGAISCWHFLQKHAPLRPQEGATIFRFWMARDTYQGTSSTQSLIFTNFVLYFQKTSGLAYIFLPCASPDAWSAMLSYFDLARIPQADYQVGAKNYGVYGHDWRVVTPTQWQQILAFRELNSSVETVPTHPNSSPVLVLNESDFSEAVQDALRNYTRADAMQKNPLLRSRLVEEQINSKGNTTERISILQTLIQNAAEILKASPRDEKLYRAIHRTYFQPSTTQEQAAELLDLPFSTYRRHLKAGVMRVVDILWRQEIS